METPDEGSRPVGAFESKVRCALGAAVVTTSSGGLTSAPRGANALSCGGEAWTGRGCKAGESNATTVPSVTLARDRGGKI